MHSLGSCGFLVSLLVFSNPCVLLSALDDIFLHQGHRQRRHPREFHHTPPGCSMSSHLLDHCSDALVFPGCRLRLDLHQIPGLSDGETSFQTCDVAHTAASPCGFRLLQFLYALPRQEGYEFFVGQWSKHELHFTSLINIQVQSRQQLLDFHPRHWQWCPPGLRVRCIQVGSSEATASTTPA